MPARLARPRSTLVVHLVFQAPTPSPTLDQRVRSYFLVVVCVRERERGEGGGRNGEGDGEGRVPVQQHQQQQQQQPCVGCFETVWCRRCCVPSLTACPCLLLCYVVVTVQAASSRRRVVAVPHVVSRCKRAQIGAFFVLWAATCTCAAFLASLWHAHWRFLRLFCLAVMRHIEC